MSLTHNDGAVSALIGSVLPGTDMPRSAELLCSELSGPHLMPLAELPGRGHHATLTGRGVAVLSELYAELASFGWRLVQRPGADHHRAATLLRSDVDTTADVRGARAEASAKDRSPMSLELLGPVSLAARLALPGGEKVLIDHGARRDLADSMAAGVTSLVEHLRRTSLPAAPSGDAPRLTVTLLEPDYARIRAGQVPTVSGYQTIRALPREETRQLVGVVVSALRAAGADEVLLDTGQAPEPEHIEDFRSRQQIQVDGFGLPVPAMDAAAWERTAELSETGAVFRANLLSEIDLPTRRAQLPQVTTLTQRLHEPWRRLGMTLDSLEQFRISGLTAVERHSMSALNEAVAMGTVARLRDTAEALTDQIRAG